MGKWIKKEIFNKIDWILVGIDGLGFILYFPSLFNFFSYDDFFHLKISKFTNISSVLQAFDLAHSFSGYEFYRPLTTQLFYSLDIFLFHLNPIPLHIISFIVYFLVILIIFKLIILFTSNKKTAYTGTFLYSVSAIHFGHLYYLGAFQELGLGFFYLLSVYEFGLFINSSKIKFYLISILLFIGALMCKESAVTLPLILILTYIYFYDIQLNRKLFDLFFRMLPFFFILTIYLYLHFWDYGLASGDSYVWSFSSRIINTIGWYLIWSMNIPEMFIDFIGPGLRINPNLFIFYSMYVIPIIGLFIALLGMIIYSIICCFNKKFLKNFKLITFSILWFLITLLPLIALPLHKFSLELTIPSFAVYLVISYILKDRKYATVTIILFLLLSVLTIRLSYITSWITQGGSSAKKINMLIDKINSRTRYIVFYDTKSDKKYPWSPTLTIKQILSNENYFSVFHPDLTPKYLPSSPSVFLSNRIYIHSSQILGY